MEKDRIKGFEVGLDELARQNGMEFRFSEADIARAMPLSSVMGDKKKKKREKKRRRNR